MAARIASCFTRRTLLGVPLAAVVATAGALPLPAVAQPAPSDKQIKLTVGFPPGTGPDVVAPHPGPEAQRVAQATAGGGQQGRRRWADRRAERGQGVADGSNLLLGEVGSISIAPAAFGKLPYDPLKEFSAIAEVVRSDFVLVVPATAPSASVADLVKAAKARGDNKINFATFGAGTPGHFGAEVFADLAGFKVESIHYRATGDAVTAIIAGDVQAAFVSTSLAMAQVKGGKMRALATTARERSAGLPDVPTFTEVGYPKADFAAWFALLAPAATPPALLDMLNRQTVAALQSADLKQKLSEAGFTLVPGGSRADTQAMLQREAQRWAAVVKQTGFKGD